VNVSSTATAIIAPQMVNRNIVDIAIVEPTSPLAAVVR
jgi:hypothetical protein